MLSSKEAVNKLLSEPWGPLQRQIVKDARMNIAEAVNGRWKIEKKGKITLTRNTIYKNDFEMHLQSGGLNLSIDSAPGYAKLSKDNVRIAAPLKGSWSGEFTCRYKGAFKAWVEQKMETPLGTATATIGEFSIPISVSQTITIKNLRIVFDLELDPDGDAKDNRPRFKKVTVHPSLKIGLSGFIHHPTITVDQFRVVADSKGQYKMECKLFDIPLAGLAMPANLGPRFTGKIVLLLLPKTKIGFEGEITFKLPKIAGWRLKPLVYSLPILIPFNFDTIQRGVENIPWVGDDISEGIEGLQNMIKLLPATKERLPRIWGEGQYEGDLQPAPMDADFVGEAIEIEESIKPHIPYGAVYEVVTPPVAKAYYEGFQDTAIWTGHYLAAESFRYAAARTDEERASALHRIELVLEGIEKLYAVTKTKGLFARAVLPDISPIQTMPSMRLPPEEERDRYYISVDLRDPSTLVHARAGATHPITESTPLISPHEWSGFGKHDSPISRDSYAGMLIGFTCAYMLVDNQEVRSTVKKLVESTLDFLLRNHWTVPTPPEQKIVTNFFNEFHYQLAWLLLGKTVNRRKYLKRYGEVCKAAEHVWVPIWGTILDPIQQYFKFNLSHAAFVALLLLEQDENLRKGYMKAFEMLRRTIRHHRNAYFDLIRILVELPENRAAAMNEQSHYNPSMTLAEEIRALLQEWLWRRESVPGPNGLPTEKTPDKEYLLSLYPTKVEEYKGLFPKIEKYSTDLIASKTALKSTFPLPVHKRPGYSMDFVWQRPPFLTRFNEGREDVPSDRSDGAHLEVPVPHPIDPAISSPVLLPKVDIGRPFVEGPGIDYLLPIWMALYLKVIK